MTDFAKYTELCKKTESLPESVELNVDDLTTALKLVVAGTELLDLIKKSAFYGKKFKREQWQTLLSQAGAVVANGNEVSRKAISHGSTEVPLDFDVRAAHAIIGMNTETGELAQNMLDSITTGLKFDEVNFGEEVGDLMWYVSIGLDATNQNFDGCLDTNIKKLEARYTSGSFSSSEAINRDVSVERVILADGVEEPKAEEPKAEEPKAEEPKAEEVAVEETKAEEPKAEEPKAEEVAVEETKAEEPKTKGRQKRSSKS